MSKPSPEPHPTEELIWEIRRLFRELARAADRALAPLGINAAERALLEFLAREDTPVSLSEIAHRRAVSRQHVHQTQARLDPKWIVRAEDPDDARAVVLSLSPAGRAFWKRIRAVDRQLIARLERATDCASTRAAVTTLRTLRATLESIQENP
jgi:DNA-binding MarR family transcriptional regulator